MNIGQMDLRCSIDSHERQRLKYICVTENCEVPFKLGILLLYRLLRLLPRSAQRTLKNDGFRILVSLQNSDLQNPPIRLPPKVGKTTVRFS